MATMDRDDPAMQMLWSPMSQQGHARYAALRSAIRTVFTPSTSPPTDAQRLRAKFAAGARRSGDAMFFETFGSPEQLLRMGDDDELCAELFAPPSSSSSSVHEPEAEAEPALTTTAAFGSKPMGHVSRLAKPTRLPTPKRISLKRTRVDESSAEKQLPLRKPRLVRLADTTNLMRASTTTTTMTNPWDRHQQQQQHALKPVGAKVSGHFSRFGVSQQQQPLLASPPARATTSAFAARRPTPTEVMTTSSTRAFALR